MMNKFAAAAFVLLTFHMLMMSVNCKVVDYPTTAEQNENVDEPLSQISDQLSNPTEDAAGIDQMLPHHEENSRALHSGDAIDAEILCDDDDVACFRRHVRVAEFKMELLNKLKMKTAPNVTRDNLPSQFTVDSLRRRYGLDVAGMQEREERVTTKEIISLAKSIGVEERKNGDRGCYFEFTEDERTFTAQKAILWMFVKADDHRVVPDYTFINLINYKHYRNGSSHAVNGPRRRVRVTTTSGHWQPIDVKNYVNKWLANQHEDRRMKIVAEDDSILAVDVSEDNSPFKPYMQVTLMKHPDRSRSKRDVYLGYHECKSKHSDMHCCKFDFEINFHRVNWDWIIYPESYNAQYCAGGCIFTHLQSSIRGKLISMASRGMATEAKSCCTPESLDAISILYYDESQNIVFTNVEGMKIHNCHCA